MTLGSLQMTGGGGIDTFSVIQAPNQNIIVNGNLTLTGSNGGSGSAGSRIGGLTDGVTNLALTVRGNITLNGGDITAGGSAIGSSGNSAAPQVGNITINADGDITLNGGTVSGTRIGQPASPVGGGDITVTAGGNIRLNGNGTTGGTIRTLGNVTLNARSISEAVGSALLVGGATAINTGTGAINLTSAINDFTGAVTLTGGVVQVTDVNDITALLAASGPATLTAGNSLVVSSSAAGVTGTANGTMTVASGGLNGGAGQVHLISTGDVILNGDVRSTASGESIVLASRFGNFINNFGPAALRVPATGRFLTYSTSPQLDRLNGLDAPKTAFGILFDPTFANISFSESGFLYRVGADNLTPAQALQAASGNGVQGQGNPDITGKEDPLSIALCMSAGGDAAMDGACESVRRNARNIRYRVAVETLRNNPTVADIPLCGPSAPEVCMPVKAGVLSDVALGPPKLDIPATEVRRKVAYLIGNNSYKGTIPQLETPISDVTAIGKVLQERMGYEVTIIKDASKADMVRTLKSIAENTTQDESVLVFYAGHGYQVESTKAGFWIPSDGVASDPRTWLSNNDVQRFLNRTDAKQIVVVSDSCFSGTLAKEQPLDAPKSALKEDLLTRRAVVTLTSGDEEPVTDEGLDGHSIFAYHFLNEMRRVQKFSPITASYERLRERIVKTYPQTPQLGAVMSAGHMSGASYLFEVK